MIDRKAILQEIVEFDRISQIRDDEFTVSHYVEEWEQRTGLQLSYDTARARLDKRVRSGTLNRRIAYCEGKRKSAYSRGETDA